METNKRSEFAETVNKLPVKKLELLTNIVDEFKLSVNDVVSYWVKSGRLNLDAATISSQAVSSEKYETPKSVLPGMYVYVDGLIYPKIIKGRQIKAVVGSVDGSQALAVCLREVCLPWSSVRLGAEATRNMTSGQKATCKILEISRGERRPAEAAQWCYDYTEDGVKQGEAFLPSLAELERLSANRNAVNTSLGQLGVDTLSERYWSSTEFDDHAVRILRVGDSYNSLGTKSLASSYVRPVLALKL